MILCCGEALIDFLPRETRDGALAFQPFVGGSIFNTSIAIGRLGVPSGFFGGLSSDFFGDQIRAALKASHVDFSLSPVSERYTICAFVKLTDGHAQYSFIDEGSASRTIHAIAIPEFGRHVSAVHLGSTSSVAEPSGTAYETLAAREHQKRVVSFDPNIRPGLIKNRDAHAKRVKRMASHADICKLSDEDMRWIAPDANPSVFAKDWLYQGAKLVVITRGGEGATAYTKSQKLDMPSMKVDVADTVGAGDTFTAGLLASLHQQGRLSKEAVASIDDTALHKALSFATQAAAITCSRPGANPPWANELVNG